MQLVDKIALLLSFQIGIVQNVKFAVYEQENYKCYLGGGGDCNTFEVLNDKQCIWSLQWSHKIASIYPYDCLKIWDGPKCTGNWITLQPTITYNGNLALMPRGNGENWAKISLSFSQCGFREYASASGITTTTPKPTTTTTTRITTATLTTTMRMRPTTMREYATTSIPNNATEHQSLNSLFRIVILTIFGLLLAAIAFILWYWRKQLKIRTHKTNTQNFQHCVIFISEIDENPVGISYPSWSWRHKKIERIGKQLWKGSYGAVYKAMRLRYQLEQSEQFLESEAIVAIKHINMHEMAQKHKWERKDFQKEAEIMSKINHENVVKILDCWIEGPDRTYEINEANTEMYQRIKDANCSLTSTQTIGSDFSLFLTLEFCSGTLEEWLNKNESIGSRMDDLNIPSMFQQIANGLRAVHKLRIIHRDLYPKNILYKEKITGEKIWKLTDFGLSKEIPTENCNQNLISLGCETYRSPEMIDKKGYNLQTDVFSLGLIYFEILLPAETLNLCKKRRVFNEIRTLREEKLLLYYNSIPPGLQKTGKIVKQMLNIDPNKRLTTSKLKFPDT